MAWVCLQYRSTNSTAVFQGRLIGNEGGTFFTCPAKDEDSIWATVAFTGCM